MNWHAIFAGIIVTILFILMVFFIKKNPGEFTSEKLTQGFRTLGILGLVLIIVVGLLVMISRA